MKETQMQMTDSNTDSETEKGVGGTTFQKHQMPMLPERK